ncbi:MAG: transglutaminase domain-containing protein [Lachnospiraceae bacterium]|nr:transglutaminase domain-containing protein [Lachnospiraceae bacterium]
MGNGFKERFLNIFKQDEAYRMSKADAEKTLANVFAQAGREPGSHTLEDVRPKDRPAGKRAPGAWKIAAAVLLLIAAAVVFLLFLNGCGVQAKESPAEAAQAAIKTGVGTRNASPECLTPRATGNVIYGNELAEIDASNAAEGYITVSYLGDCPKVKLQITGSNGVTYTFNCKGNGEQEVFPLSSGDGTYQVAVYENIEGSQYASAYTSDIEVTLNDPTRPYLYPNQYVRFDRDSMIVALGQELAMPCDDDLEVVSNVYNWLIANVTYDEEEAKSVQSGYIPDIDAVMERRTGICLDYAALMAAMLRSQRIPTRLEVGYAGIAYHAWISTYIKDIGWVNGIVQFDGQDWQMMDPTFAANSSESDLKTFIGSGDSYELKYSY